MEDDDFEDHTRGYVPPNTTYDTQKCVKLFTEWAEAMNEFSKKIKCQGTSFPLQIKRKFADGYAVLLLRSERKEENPIRLKLYTPLPYGHPASH